jgi:hypothetical protein
MEQVLASDATNIGKVAFSCSKIHWADCNVDGVDEVYILHAKSAIFPFWVQNINLINNT